MYKQSKDRRFQKNKREIRRAFIDLTVERGFEQLTISMIADRADINRMTFYAHYDSIEDIFREFVDDMEKSLMEQMKGRKISNLDTFFEMMNGLMYQELDFFRHVAKEGNLEQFRAAFKATIGKLVRFDLAGQGTLTERQQVIMADLAAAAIAYSYLDWLAGEYGDAELSEVIEVTKSFLGDTIEGAVFSA